MQLVAVWCGLMDKVVGVKNLQVAAGLGERTIGQSCQSVGVDARPGMDPEQGEDPLPFRGEVVVGHGEHGPDRAVPGGQILQAVGVLGKQVGQVGDAPGGVAAQPASGQRDRQRQIATQLDHPRHRFHIGRGGGVGIGAGEVAVSQRQQHVGGLVGGHHVQSEGVHTVQGG